MKLTTPGETVGVIGGGQLGRMLGEAAAPLGIEIICLDPTPDAPASPVTRSQIEADFDDREAVQRLAEKSDYLTYEIELADPEILKEVSNETDVPVHPSPRTLEIIEDKLHQNETFRDNGVSVPSFRAVSSLDDLMSAIDDLGLPAMLKARMGGYDGRGNIAIHSRDEAERAIDEVAGPALLEEYLEFDRELAVIGCRGENETDLFPVTETIHREEILRQTVAPAQTSDSVKNKARKMARDVLELMEGRGVFGIEMFEVDGEVLLNEVAPRPHNSGHWTIEGCYTSQFEQHLRGVTGLPLGSTELRCGAVSCNILGDVDEPCRAVLSGAESLVGRDRLALHWYAKKEVRPLRKMGHFTVQKREDESLDGLLEEAQRLNDDIWFE